jgi:hypothetical protein
MTFLEELTAHKGGLVRIKTQLFWYGGRARGGWDGARDRVCLLMDAAARLDPAALDAAARVGAVGTGGVGALLLVDGAPRWVWVAQADVELL